MTDHAVNGSAFADLTPAQRLMQQHITDDHTPPHKVEIEEVIDQEDLEHPPPSSSSKPGITSAQASTGQSAAKKPLGPSIDTQSDEAFPALGTPTPRSTTATPTTWSAKPSSRLGTDKASNGPNGGANGTTPSSGSTSASAGVPRGAVRGPAVTSMPGRHTERVQFAPSQLMPRKDLKRPVLDVLRDINRKSKARVDMSTGPGGVVIFEGTGPVESVRQALKEVAKELGSKQSVNIPVPVSVKGNVIGRQGSTIQNISKRTGARIQMGRQEPGALLDDDATVDVLIEGDAISAEMARREIEAIVNEHTSTVNMRLRNIPPEYYPFLAGQKQHTHRANQLGDHDVRINIPQYFTWVDEAPTPAHTHRKPVAFSTTASQPISIAGDRHAAVQARELIEQQVAQLAQRLTVEQMAIEKARHQFIFGDQTASLEEFMNETGCAVIFPPDGNDSETVTIIGPPEHLEDGMNKIMDLASSMHMTNIDIARQHANAPAGAQKHARNVNKYLHNRRAIKGLERQHNTRIMAQTADDTPTSWEVYSQDAKNAMRARSDIMNLISGFPPQRFAPVAVDPFFHDELRGDAARQLREQHGVHMVVPDAADEEPEVILVFEGPSSAADFEMPRRAPNGQELQTFGPALQGAQAFIEQLVGPQTEIVVEEMQAPVKFHEKIRRHAHKHHQSRSHGRKPVQVRVGGQQKRGEQPTHVSMRGPRQDVAELAEALAVFVEMEERDELERDFTLTFDFPQKHANQLIGKNGANVKKLREEFDVEIRLDEGKVQLRGPEAKANACKSHIQALARKFEDEVTHVLKVNAKFHKDMIGAKGAQVNRLQDRYKVRINFPRAGKGDDDAENEHKYQQQAVDEVLIRGPKRGADEARDELLSLLQYTMDTSHAAVVSVAQSQIPKLIGAGGRELDALRAETGAQIDIPSKEEVDASGRAQVKVKGTKKQVEDAKKALEQAVKEFDSTVTRKIEVDKKHHRSIIGPGGATLRTIASKAGASDDRQQLARMIRFPKADAEGNTIVLEGGEQVLDSIVQQIMAIVLEKEEQTTQTIDVAPEKHRLLIGRGGETRRHMESQFGVSIDIPRQTETGPARSHVKVTGRPENVEKAIAHIKSQTQDKEGRTVQIPMKHHHAIADNGQFFRKLRNDHKVSVSHNGAAPPRKRHHKRGRRAGNLPLITDDAGTEADKFSWETTDLLADAPEGEIPWLLSGESEADLDKAASKLEAALRDAEDQNTSGYLFVPDPRSYGLIIGPGGSGINKIRKDTRTKINVPKNQDEDEAIEIIGTLEGCEMAKDMIIAAIQGGR